MFTIIILFETIHHLLYYSHIDLIKPINCFLSVFLCVSVFVGFAMSYYLNEACMLVVNMEQAYRRETMEVTCFFCVWCFNFWNCLGYGKTSFHA